jgi:adenine-specific DNA glycosylase
MWQFSTIAAGRRAPTVQILQSALSLRTDQPTQLANIRHDLTHRRYEFDVFICRLERGAVRSRLPARRWVTLGELHRYPLPRPHLRIAALLKALDL